MPWFVAGMACSLLATLGIVELSVIGFMKGETTMTHHSCKLLILTMLFASCAAASVYAETLFFDDFDGPTLNPIWQAGLPNAPYAFHASGSAAIYQGESNFSFQSLDGSSVIRLQNILGDAQRRGWSSSTSFPSEASIIYEARFNTLVQSFSTGIDELLEIWLLDSNNPDNYDIVALYAPGYGFYRNFTASSSITNVGLDTDFPFTNNTWYRMVISGSMTQEVRASVYDDAGTVELIGVNLGHNLGAYTSGFRIGISQSMGSPGFPFPTDVALDSVRLTASRKLTSFNAALTLTLGPQAHDDALGMLATFTLSQNSNGINPLAEEVRLQVGTFSTTIPAGSFRRAANGAFEFWGVIGGVSLQLGIVPPHRHAKESGAFELYATAKNANLTGTPVPVTVGLTIGDDEGSTTLKTVKVMGTSSTEWDDPARIVPYPD